MSVKTMLQSVIIRSLLERDFCSTEICHFVNHEYVNFSCDFITVNLTDENEYTVEFNENEKVNLKKSIKTN